MCHLLPSGHAACAIGQRIFVFGGWRCGGVRGAEQGPRHELRRRTPTMAEGGAPGVAVCEVRRKEWIRRRRRPRSSSSTIGLSVVASMRSIERGGSRARRHRVSACAYIYI
jgi:hypothetical protein